MATLAQMRSRIADDLNRSDIDTQIDKAINRAILYYNKKRFWFNEAVDTFSTIASQKSYGTADGIPDDIQQIFLTQATVNSTKFPLTPKPYNFIVGIDSDSFTGYPEFWGWFDDKIWFYPTPNDVFTITLSYQQNFDELSADGDSNAFTTNAEDLIEARARWWLYTRILQDKEESAIAKQEEMEAFDCLSAKTENFAHMPTGFQPTVY